MAAISRCDPHLNTTRALLFNGDIMKDRSERRMNVERTAFGSRRFRSLLRRGAALILFGRFTVASGLVVQIGQNNDYQDRHDKDKHFSCVHLLLLLSWILLTRVTINAQGKRSGGERSHVTECSRAYRGITPYVRWKLVTRHGACTAETVSTAREPNPRVFGVLERWECSGRRVTSVIA